MGMLFNTDATREMLARINAEFSAANKYIWKGRHTDFAGGLKLHGIAKKWGVVPTTGGAGAKTNWEKWLDGVLHMTPCDPNLTYAVPGVTTYYPPVNPTSDVGAELRRLLRKAIRDDFCTEIIMVIQPDTKVCILQSEAIPSGGGYYSLAITLCTMDVTLAFTRAARLAKRRSRVGGRKKKKR